MQAYEQLEAKFAEWNQLDPKGMVACSSGTAALHLAIEALQLPQVAEILIPDFAMVACPRAATLAGLTPVFVDCDERLLMDPGHVQDYIADPDNNVHGRLAAVMAVHIYGRLCDMREIGQQACDIGAKVIEDMAEAHGAKPHPSADAACWSFYRNKIIHGEEGGAVWFRDPKHADLARQLRTLGFTPEHNYRHVPRGHNYRLSNAHAELILKSLAEADENILRRREIEGWYDACCPSEWRMPHRDCVWVYDLKLPIRDDLDIDDVVGYLRRNGIEARCGFKPMHAQQEYSGCKLVASGRSVISRRMARSVLYLPVQPGVTTQASVRKSFELLRRALGE